MAELVREIVQEDLPIVKDLLAKAGKEKDYETIERLGGMTNHSYKVTLKNGEELLVRIPGEGTEKMINYLKTMENDHYFVLDSVITGAQYNMEIMRYVQSNMELDTMIGDFFIFKKK